MIEFDKMDLTKDQTEQNQGYTIGKISSGVNIPENADLDKNYKETIEGGICYALSLEWLRLLLPSHDFGNAYHVDENLAYYKQIANNFFAYASDSPLVTGSRPNDDYSSREMDETFVEMGTRKEFEVIGERSGYTWNEMADIIADMSDSPYMFIRMDFTYRIDGENKEAAHQVAAFRLNDHCVYFFDPNFGTVRIVASNAAGLRNKVGQLIQYLYNHFTNEMICVRYLG